MIPPLVLKEERYRRMKGMEWETEQNRVDEILLNARYLRERANIEIPSLVLRVENVVNVRSSDICYKKKIGKNKGI